MNNEKKDISDLLADESFVNYCKQTSPEDIIYWEKYIRDNPAQKELIEVGKEKLLQLFNALASADLEEQSLRLESRLTRKEPTPVIKIDEWKEAGKRSSLPLVKITAVAAAILVAGLFAMWYFTDSSRKAIKTFVASYGERKNIQLPDGSVVNLNAGSKIEIDDDFDIAARNVRLEGEAFFDVKHNAALPFIVQTRAIDVKALGTAFDVKAYDDETITEASLIRGLIEVTLKENQNSVLLLHPNEKIVWKHAQKAIENAERVTPKSDIQLPTENKVPEKLTITDQGDIKEIAWKENKLVLEDDTFTDIIPLLERWYGVAISIDDESIRNYRFTATFEKEDLQTVLGFLKESRNFNYKIQTGETIKVSLTK